MPVTDTKWSALPRVHQLAPTSAPTWMDGAVIGFPFLSLCHPRLTSFLCSFSSLKSVFFFLQLYFLPAPHPVFFFSRKLFPPTYSPPPMSPTDLLTYIFKLKLDSSPSTYSPINLKCATLIPTHPPTCPSTILPTNTLSRYLPNPTYLHGCHSNKPPMVNSDEEQIK